MRLAGICAIGLAAMTSAAAAQDWSGFYAGFSAATGTTELSGPLLGGSDFSGSDVSPGVFVGYNHMTAGNWVLGGELSYAAGGANVDLGGGTVELDGLAMLRGRVGYANGQVMPYLAAGIAGTEISIPAGGVTSDETGVNVGIGVEYLFSNNMSVRAEYGITRYDGVLSPPVPAGGLDTTVEAITVGVAWHF